MRSAPKRVWLDFVTVSMYFRTNVHGTHSIRGVLLQYPYSDSTIRKVVAMSEKNENNEPFGSPSVIGLIVFIAMFWVYYIARHEPAGIILSIVFAFIGMAAYALCDLANKKGE